MNKSIPLVVIIFLIAIYLIVLSARTESREVPTPTPTPSAVVIPNDQKYIDLMTKKCYANVETPQEVEVPCKG